MKLLAVNADDAGLHVDTDEAILRCIRRGIVRNTTVIVNGATAADFLALAPETGIDIGLHLNLTLGRASAGPASTLTDNEGNFPQPKSVIWHRAMAGELDGDQVRAEVEAQVDAFRASGPEPSHVDGHNHVHLFPQVREALADLLPGAWFRTPDEPGFDRAGIPDLGNNFNRWSKDRSGPWPRTDCFAGHAFCRRPSIELFLSSLDPEMTFTEFMVHIGSRPGSPFVSSPDRDTEVEIVCSETLRSVLEDRGYRIVTFTEARSLCA